MVKVKTFKELADLSGRKALVTGGTGHIGRAACETLAEMGAKVALLDREKKNVPGAACFLACDLQDEKATRAVVRKAIAELGGLDILIHSAAFVGTTEFPGWAVPFEKQSVGAWEAAMQVNLTAAFILAQESREALGLSGHGSIILLSSIAGIVGPNPSLYEGTAMVSPAAYNASKGGLLQLARYLATEFAPQVRVNAISPGGVWRNQPEIFHQKYKERTPLKRMATEEDLKGAIAYLASDLSQYVTGHNLVVDGGWTIW